MGRVPARLGAAEAAGAGVVLGTGRHRAEGVVERGAKLVVEGVALAQGLPASLIYRAGALALGKQKAFAGWSQAFALLPGLTGVYLRRAFYRLVLPRCEEGACLSFAVIFSHPTAEVGRNVYVGPFCCLGDVTL